MIVKSKRVSFKDLGIKSMPRVNDKYYEMAQERKERWAKEDAQKNK